MQDTNIAFIGAGNMASAIIGGLINNGYAANKLWVADPIQESLDTLQDSYGLNISIDNNETVSQADVVLLAVKPQMMATVCQMIQATVRKKNPLIISIAAGVTSHMLSGWLSDNVSIVRCMPNTPALVQQGATALYANQQTNNKQQQIAEHLLKAVGSVTWVEQEHLLDAVTAVSGSGPAYFFYVIEAMQAAGEALGLSAEIAKQLTLQTAIGAATMALHSDVDAKELRRRVTSPKGTTEAAIQVFDDKQLMSVFMEALKAADARAKSLAEEMQSFN